VSGSDDGAVRLWDALHGAHLIILIGNNFLIDCVAFSPDSTRIVSGSRNETLHLWDAVSGVHLDTMPGRSLFASSVARSLSSTWTSFSRPDAMPSESTSPIFGYVTDDGWIYSMALNRRICWVPRSLRPRAVDVTRDRVVFGTDDGRVVILRFNNTDYFL
jgi:WD40 repeat protein